MNKEFLRVKKYLGEAALLFRERLHDTKYTDFYGLCALVPTSSKRLLLEDFLVYSNYFFYF